MRNVIMFNMLSLDGYFEGPGGDIDWHNVDEEFNQFAVEQAARSGGLIFGRVTYQLMDRYWPTPAAAQNNPQIAGLMNRLPKIVFSHTLLKSEWENTELTRENAPARVRALKQQPGGDLLIFGSAELSAELGQEGLIDEYRLMINPVVLGGGRALFANLREPLPLRLLCTRAFQNGNVLLVYAPAG